MREQIKILSFTFGRLSSDLIGQLTDNGTIVIGTVTSKEEAEQLSQMV